MRADDTPITPEYAASTVKRKISKGQPYDRVTLRDTGAFWQGIFDDVRDTELYIDSTDIKADSLIKRYGAIFGLNTKSRDEYTPIAGKVYFDNVRKILKL